MRAAALIATSGSLDWLCFPQFDSPSGFAAILDDERGGRFLICPSGEYRSKQLYLPDSNVLVTRFFSDTGVAEITDYMPVGAVAEQYGRRCVVRHVTGVRGRMAMRMRCAPAFDFARMRHRAEAGEGGVWFRSPQFDLALGSDVPVQVDGDAAVSDFVLDSGDEVTFVLGHSDPLNGSLRCPPEREHDLLMGAVEYWHRWLAKSTYRG